MKTTHRIILSIGASLGAALLVISVLSIINVLNSQSNSDNIWSSYMESFYHYLNIMPYLVVGTFILLLLFFVLKVQEKKLSN